MSWRHHKDPRPKRKMTKQESTSPLEELIAKHSPEYIIGIDEVGWGAIAGPVVVACAVYKVDFTDKRIRDSKTYTTGNAREKACKIVHETAVYVGYHEVSCGELEVYGPGPMLQFAFKSLAERAISHYPNSLVIVDGKNKIKQFSHPQAALPKADSYVTAVSAASILAKVSRDTTMTCLGEDFPEYEWFSNRGYGTPFHLGAISEVGVSVHHRRNIQTILDLELAHGTYEGNRK